MMQSIGVSPMRITAWTADGDGLHPLAGVEGVARDKEGTLMFRFLIWFVSERICEYI